MRIFLRRVMLLEFLTQLLYNFQRKHRDFRNLRFLNTEHEEPKGRG